MMSPPTIRRHTLCALLITCGCLFSGCERKPASGAAAITPEVIDLNNRGVGLMGKFEYELAAEQFSKALKLAPDSIDLQVNLAIATLNQNRPEAEDEALKMLFQVLKQEPKHPRANYCAALLLKYKGRMNETLTHFQIAAEAAPNDAFAAFGVGESLMSAKKLEDARHWEEVAIKADPYLQSAYYQLNLIHMRLKNIDEAKRNLAISEKIKNNPLHRAFDFKYTKMGKLAEATMFGPVTENTPPPKSPVDFAKLFASASPLPIAGADGVVWKSAPEDEQPSITVCDIDGDDQLDLFLAGVIEHGGATKNAVLLRRGEQFALQLDHPLAQVTDIRAVLWGDYDNDGRTDVYFCRRGSNQLWRQREKNVWLDVTEATNASGGDLDTVGGAMADLDHDGDLDIFLVRANGANELLINTCYLDGNSASRKADDEGRETVFRPIGAEHGLAGDGRPSRSVVIADLDGDRDFDLIVLHDQPPHEVYRNDLLWKYAPADGFDEFKQSSAKAMVAIDADVDGMTELYSLADGKLTQWKSNDEGVWKPRVVNAAPIAVKGPEQLAIADLSGTGEKEAIIGSQAGWSIVALQREGKQAPLAIDAPSAGWALTLLDPTRGPAVVAVEPMAAPRIWRPGSSRLPFTSFRLIGRDLASKQSRSNASGIGAVLHARCANQWFGAGMLPNQSGPGQSLAPAVVGVDKAKKIDFIAIHWSSGVYQAELDFEAGKQFKVEEENRLPISCPLLFAWDGEKLAFVTDMLGVGGLGFATGPGEYAPADPTENILLPEGSIAARDGKYHLTLEEGAEESTYIDAVGLVAYDLPPGWQMLVDERMAPSPPAATGDALFFRTLVMPERATNDRGEDVTDRLARDDRVAAEPGDRDPRFIGLTREHSVTLEFAEPLDKLSGKPVLLMDGWIEYPFSQTVFAAWQAGIKFRAPTLAARDGQGMWRDVAVEFGYPAGMPRQAAFPLPKLPLGARALRLTTTNEVYWDRLAVAVTEPCSDVVRRELPLERAELRVTGFAKRAILDQRISKFDDRNRSPFGDARRQSGLYTRFGPVDELVGKRDNALAVYGPGEGLHLEFAAPAEEPPAGWTRRIVLETVGWCKDMDFYTEHGQTLDPLPTDGLLAPEQQRRREALHEQYNTRITGGY